MESPERKDSSTNLEEPVKSEMLLDNSDSNDRANNATSPPPNCSICLGKLINTSFTDSCLHQFCFTCLLQWSKIKTECPLCKQNFKSIIHNVRSEGDYDQYNVQMTSVAAALEVTAERLIDASGLHSRFMYRSTYGAHRRLNVLINGEAVARQEQIPSVARPSISGEERRQRMHDPIEFRRSVYNFGRWSDPSSLSDAFGRFRECTPEYFRRNPSAVDRLVPWLNRELQALLNEAPHIAYAMNVILDAITNHSITGNQFSEIIRPYFGVQTNHFVHEFHNFARSNLDLVGYDRSVMYLNGLTHGHQRTLSPITSSSSSSDDSDIRILDNLGTRRTTYPLFLQNMQSSLLTAPGPSTVGQILDLIPSLSAPVSVYTISSTSSESENECEVVGYVKPRHERTPEIIDLSSSDERPNRDTPPPPQASTSQSVEVVSASEAPEQPLIDEPENLPGTSYDSGSIQNRQSRSKAEVAKAQIYEILNTSTDYDSDFSYTIKLKSTTRSHKTSKKAGQKSSSGRKTRSKKRKTSIRLRKVATRSSSRSDDNSHDEEQEKSKSKKKRRHEESSTKRSSTKSKRKCTSSSCVKSRRRSKRFKNSSSSSSSSESSDDEKRSSIKFRDTKVVLWQRATSSDSDEENECLSKRLCIHDNAQKKAKSPEMFLSYSDSRGEKKERSSEAEKEEYCSSSSSSSSSCSSRDEHRQHRKHKSSNRRRSRS